MKKTQTIFTLVLLLGLLGISELSAQYGYGNPYGYGSRYGRQRSIVPNTPDAPKEPENLTAEEIVDQQMPSITEALALDPFEEAVVRTTLVKSVQQRIEVQILELEGASLQEAVEKIKNRQDEELKTGLPEDKYQAFQELQENKFKTKKKKKGKKEKKKKSKK
ncbi:hypothetical protein [Flagellimonas nanhaiensis]|uniref:Uncharacterized protein n=1 Tax=Flagellimonas nanhaiensis TaxID=2292706 RepID=A0A371JV94_9FLAO|nr:hypothetical protein [Allomuricauda nanhaiensis]RDY61731.1 hypothetical protein DX873_06165 [Allomuricauda nanhaiensis]